MSEDSNLDCALKINSMCFPLIVSNFRGTPSSEEYIQSHKILVDIYDEKIVEITLGVWFKSEQLDQEEEKPLVSVLVESVFRFELDYNIKKLSLIHI